MISGSFIQCEWGELSGVEFAHLSASLLKIHDPWDSPQSSYCAVLRKIRVKFPHSPVH